MHSQKIGTAFKYDFLMALKFDLKSLKFPDSGMPYLSGKPADFCSKH